MNVVFRLFVVVVVGTQANVAVIECYCSETGRKNETNIFYQVVDKFFHKGIDFVISSEEQRIANKEYNIRSRSPPPRQNIQTRYVCKFIRLMIELHFIASLQNLSKLVGMKRVTRLND